MKNGYTADLAAEVFVVMVCDRQPKMLSINLAIEEDCHAHGVSSAQINELNRGHRMSQRIKRSVNPKCI